MKKSEIQQLQNDLTHANITIDHLRNFKENVSLCLKREHKVREHYISLADSFREMLEKKHETNFFLALAILVLSLCLITETAFIVKSIF